MMFCLMKPCEEDREIYEKFTNVISREEKLTYILYKQNIFPTKYYLCIMVKDLNVERNLISLDIKILKTYDVGVHYTSRIVIKWKPCIDDVHGVVRESMGCRLITGPGCRHSGTFLFHNSVSSLTGLIFSQMYNEASREHVNYNTWDYVKVFVEKYNMLVSEKFIMLFLTYAAEYFKNHRYMTKNCRCNVDHEHCKCKQVINEFKIYFLCLLLSGC